MIIQINTNKLLLFKESFTQLQEKISNIVKTFENVQMSENDDEFILLYEGNNISYMDELSKRLYALKRNHE